MNKMLNAVVICKYFEMESCLTKQTMSQLTFTHKNYDPFHLYIRLIKYVRFYYKFATYSSRITVSLQLSDSHAFLSFENIATKMF